MKNAHPVISKWIVGGILVLGFSSVAQAKPAQAAKKPNQQPAKFQSVRKPASKPAPLIKYVQEEAVITNVVDGKMDSRESSLQNCLVELKVPTIYEANISNGKGLVEIWEVADAKKTIFSFPVNPNNRSGNLNPENFFKAAVYNRLLKEVRAKEEIMAQMKKPNIFQRAFGIETSYDKMLKRYDYKGEQCARFMTSIGRGKFAAELRSFIDNHQSNLMALKGKQPQPMNLSYYVKGSPRPGLASLTP